MNNSSQTQNRGSEWNVWDLHIHTPASFHWKEGKCFQGMTPEETQSSCQNIIKKINLSEPIAFSIVDYFTFDGILKIRDFLNKNPTNTLQKTVFPGIELRLEAPTDFRPNIQVIFSEKTTDQELNDFKSELEIFKSERPLSEEAIIEIAKTLIPDKARKHIGTGDYKNNEAIAYELGCKIISITRHSFKTAIKKRKNKCLVMLPYETFNGIEKLNWEKHPIEDMYYLGLADFFESRKPENIDLFLGKETPKNEKFFYNFQQAIGGKPKPVLSGSDAHKIENYGNFPNGKKTWLKAEPTFKGLEQIIAEPISRCFIGETPEKLNIIKSKATKFISKIKIEKKPDSIFDEKWFDNEVFFNPELVAVIGNKGSGKSALTDVLGLLGNSRRHDSFSFLNNKKFKEKGGYKAKNFRATLSWQNGDNDEASSLNDEVLFEKMEKIKYIPQSHLEKLCNEISSQKNLFDKELKSVIFSHIPPEQRLDKENLDDLLDFKTEEISTEISNLQEELKHITIKILDNRKKITEEYRENLNSKFSAIQKEFEALNNSKPKAVPKPTLDTTDKDIQEKIKKLETLKIEERTVIEKIIFLKNDLSQLSKKKATLDKAIAQIHILEESVTKSTQEIKLLLKSVGYHNVKFFTFEVKISPLKDESNNLNNELKHKNQQLITLNDDFTLSDNCLEAKKKNIQEEIKNLSEQIDEPNKKYQEYLLKLENWKQSVLEIKGDKNKPNTLSYLSSKLSELTNIPTKITELESKRDELVKMIYGKINLIATIYKDYYNPVQSFLDTKPFEEDTFKISFNVSIEQNNFKGKFFNLINRHKAGTFYGTENSEKRMKQLLDKYDFNNPEMVIQFVNDIFRFLENDYRGDEVKNNRFELQAKSSPEDLYNMIFGLEYLKPKYFLQLNGKSLEQLSPGERGILLLVFYLMIDKDERPLILDQPEENLDNQTIYKVLVKCIKKAKENRQIFLVYWPPIDYTLGLANFLYSTGLFIPSPE